MNRSGVGHADGSVSAPWSGQRFGRNMPLDVNALDSLSASLDDLVDRLGSIAREAGDEDEIAIELREVERQLETASRRLVKAVLRSRR